LKHPTFDIRKPNGLWISRTTAQTWLKRAKFLDNITEEPHVTDIGGEAVTLHVDDVEMKSYGNLDENLDVFEMHVTEPELLGGKNVYIHIGKTILKMLI